MIENGFLKYELNSEVITLKMRYVFWYGSSLQIVTDDTSRFIYNSIEKTWLISTGKDNNNGRFKYKPFEGNILEFHYQIDLV